MPLRRRCISSLIDVFILNQFLFLPVDVQVKKREKTALDTSVAEALMIPTSLDRKEDGGYGFPVKSFFLSTWDSPMVMNGKYSLSFLSLDSRCIRSRRVD
jgi:hypothetical protein